jgi:protein-tyrosine phosphatase
MSLVEPGLWLGGAEHAYNIGFMKGAKITHVINCADELNREYGLEISVSNIPLQDLDSEEEEPNARENILHAASLLHKIRQGEQNSVLLIHCRAGISRSPTVVMAWLILHRGLTYKEAWDIVSKARNIIYPNKYYREILKSLVVPS